jgi:hypothetical protein
MIVIALALAGLGAGLLLVTAGLRRRPARVDYRERWLQAVSLLGEEGRLTDEQVTQITGTDEQVAQIAGATATPPAAPPARAIAAPASQAVLRRMESWDRRDLEVTRAKRGLPPADDLAGMESWDQRDVLQARARYGKRQ